MLGLETWDPCEPALSVVWSSMAYIQWFSRVLNQFQKFDLVDEILILYTMYFGEICMVLCYNGFNICAVR